VSAAVAQREVALAAIALLAAIVALAVTSHGGSARPQSLLQPVTLDGGHWRTSLAGATATRYGRRTDCGILLRPGTIGITDSVLPCGIKLYVAYKSSPQVLTQVIEHRPVPPGRRFELTPKLAEKLGVDGVQQIHWVFAGATPS